MELSCVLPTKISDDSLESWQRIGCGGFGEIYRVKHTKWGMEVAVKLLRFNDGSGSSLLREADLMRHGGNPNVLRILGVYEGNPQGKRSPSHLGLVMEYMERGSLADLQEALNGPPPWPLAFRIAHQIALGLNFLHQLSPPILHLDLKPSNVLLDDSLNAKLTDFGLAKVARSVSKMAGERDEEIGGTTSYMPPEAFQLSSYIPSFSSDIYSYGVLLWSIVTGKEPYRNNITSLVRFRVSEGDRPNLTAVDTRQANGLSDLTELMQSCWNADPKLRPTFIDCVKVTEKVYHSHKKEVHNDVHAIQKKLEAKNDISHHLSSLSLDSNAGNGCLKANSIQDSNQVKTEPAPAQEASRITVSRPKEPSLPDSIRKPAPKAQLANHRPPGTQRQFSTPQPGGARIYLSNVSGVQIGKNNYMHISSPQESQRRRHPTAPPHFPNSHQPSK